MKLLPRLERLRNHLKAVSCDALLVEHPIDLFYLTGIKLSAGKVIVTPSSAHLIVDGRYFEICQNQQLYQVYLAKDYALKECLADLHISQLAIDQDHTTLHSFINLEKELSSQVKIQPIDSAVQQLRMIKEKDEIELLKQAAHLGYQGYEHLLSLLQEGILEKELAFELEFFWKKRGASHLAFDSIIAFGKNGSMPHYRSGLSPLIKNSSVLIDIGLVLNDYHSDMTRVNYFGNPPEIIKEIYAIVEEAKNKALALCRPGIPVKELDKAARSSIEAKGYGNYFTHSLGHGIGLETHEPPILRQTGSSSEILLKPGMAITIEPGIYLPGIGGVRLEDTIVITESGYENLYLS